MTRWTTATAVLACLALAVTALWRGDRQAEADEQIVKAVGCATGFEDATWLRVTLTCFDSVPGINGGPLDCHGVPLRGRKVVAVDPAVIALGSQVWVNGAWHEAADVGEAIRGARADVFVPGSSRKPALRFKRQEWIAVRK